ncbi:MAG: L-histidine N(alpha)-methyltransferase [Tranquillimonas sp.]
MDRRVVENADLLSAAQLGLGREPKSMEPKWFYDARGSELFEQITDLPEYYPTRTEIAILRDNLDLLVACIPDGADLVELGSGASRKTRLLLDNLPKLGRYVPLDISAEFLHQTADDLRAAYPDLTVAPRVADFASPLQLPDSGHPRVAFFPGSTLGNLDRAAAQRLLAAVRDWPGIDAFIIGVDLVKDAETLIRAYDDAAGVTADFNLNLLHRMNREIGSDFEVDAFRHRAVWNAEEARIEMHLASLRDQEVRIADRIVRFREGETIHTENSHKFTADGLSSLAGSAGWRVEPMLSDPERLFAVAVLRPA